jgi:hypothetical protein
MQRKDMYLTAILWLLVVLIFYPVFFADYIYTDESIQLWLYKPGSDFNMFVPQGRWITNYLFSKLFGAIDTVHEILYIRLFSLVGWLICLPIWYIVIKRVVAKEPAYAYLPFFTCLYLVTSLGFSISIQWASCLELFLANTAGLLSGAVLYQAIRFEDNRWRIAIGAAIGSLVLGVISLFTYQNGFGCFLIPFLLHFIARHTTKKDQVFMIGMIVHFLVYGVYFLLFKLSLKISHIPNDSRTDLYINLLDKIQFFFTHPFKRSFWFNIIVYENDKVARAIYKVLFIGWMAAVFVRAGLKHYILALKQIAVVLLICLVVYMPTLIVKEIFASNRTMLALNICVWLVCAEMIIYFIKNVQLLRWTGVAAAAVLVTSSWHNLRHLFLRPVEAEYSTLRAHIQQHYHPGIKTIYFVHATLDAFEKKYHIQSTMDEFGVPSTAFDWVAEWLPKQIIYEITGSRTTADQLVIKHWPDIEGYTRSGETMNNTTIMINMPELIAGINP